MHIIEIIIQFHRRLHCILETAILQEFIFCGNLHCHNLSKNARKKAFVVILVTYLLYLLWMTGARTCMIAAIFVVASAILPVKIRIPKMIVALCFAFPILFVPMYLMLFRSGYADLMIMGKSLFSGRQGTFTDYLSLLRTNFQWIVGNLGEASFANAHNAPLAHLCSTGLLGTILFYGMMLKNLGVL